MNATKAINTVVRDVQGNTTQVTIAEDNAITTLIWVITKHFVGDPTRFENKSLEILNNLICPKL